MAGLNRPIENACLHGDWEAFHNHHHALDEPQQLLHQHRYTSPVPLLHMAVAGGNRAIVQALLLLETPPRRRRMTACVHARDDFLQNTALHVAVVHHPSREDDDDAAGMVRLLLRHGAAVDAANAAGWTALHLACRSPPTPQQRVEGWNDTKKQVVQVLLDHGADPLALSSNNNNNNINQGGPPQTSVDMALKIRNKGYGDALVLQLARAACSSSTMNDLSSSKDDILGSLLHKVYERQHLSTLCTLLERYPMLIHYKANRQTVLYRASVRGQTDIMQCVLRRGAPVSGSLLHNICARRNVHTAVVQLLLDYYYGDVNALNTAAAAACTEEGQTPLHTAIANTSVVNLLLSRGARVNVCDQQGRTPLALATMVGNLPTVEALVQHGSRTDQADYNKETPLHHACRENHVRVAVFLLHQADTDIHAQNCDGWTPLHVACFHQQLPTAAFLIRRGAQLDSTDWKTTPLHLACQVGQRAKVLHRLVRSFSELQFDTEINGITTLHANYRSNNVQLVNHLLEQGAPLNGCDEFGMTALHYACDAASMEVVECLLDRRDDIDVNCQSHDGLTPLHVTCKTLKFSTLELARLLVKHGGNIDSMDAKGLSPLHYACDSSCLDVVQFLLEHGAHVNQASLAGCTPLHYACRRRNVDLVKLLLAQPDVDINSASQHGETPLYVASQRWGWNVVELLLQHGANVHLATLRGRTPLHEVVATTSQDTVRLLIQRGAVLDKADDNGLTPFCMASQNVPMLYFLLREYNALSHLC